MIKLDSKGNEQWQHTIGGSGQVELACAFQTRDGGYIIGGFSSSSPAQSDVGSSVPLDTKPDLYSKSEKSRGNLDYWIVKLDKTGI